MGASFNPKMVRCMGLCRGFVMELFLCWEHCLVSFLWFVQSKLKGCEDSDFVGMYL